MEIEYIFGGGFYQFNNLEGSSGQYDVSMLVGSIDDYDILQKMRAMYDMQGPAAPLPTAYASNNAHKLKPNPERALTFEDIKEGISGTARIIRSQSGEVTRITTG